MGTLPDDFPYFRQLHIPLDRKRMTARMPWGQEIAVRPFFGQLAVAPRPEFGRQNSKEPREFGGNLDCKELIAGSTIFLPVWNDGALFSTGDGHARQGDGEVDGTAIETSLAGTFEFIVRKDLKLRVPRAESPTHFITMGLNADLDDAGLVKRCARWSTSSSSAKAFRVTTLMRSRASSVDLHVTQTVNNVKGVHAMLERGLAERA